MKVRRVAGGVVFGLGVGLGAWLVGPAPASPGPQQAPAEAPKADDKADPGAEALRLQREALGRALEAAEARAAEARAKAWQAEVDLFLREHPQFKNREAVTRALADPDTFHAWIRINRERRRNAVADRVEPADAAAEARHQALQRLIDGLENVIAGQVAAQEQALAASAPKPPSKAVVAAVKRLADQLQAHPVPATKRAEKLVLFLVDLDAPRGMTRIADEPVQGLTHAGSPEWSKDGKSLLFDATPTPGNAFNLTRILALEAGPDKPALKDLGPGNCPSGSPDGSRVVFLLNPGAVAGAEAAVWVMHADGTERDVLSEYGRPRLSDDGKKLLTVSFSDPPALTILDLDTEHVESVQNLTRTVRSVPAWAGKDEIIAVLDGGRSGDSVALIDVSNPQQAKVKEVLWTAPDVPRLRITYPAFSSTSRRYAFLGWDGRGMGVYLGKQNEPGPPKRVEAVGIDNTLSAPTFSPDGRYLVVVGDRLDDQAPAAKPGP